MARTPEQLAIALSVGEILDALGIAYMTCGSVASSLHGEPRTTFDLDMVVDLRAEHLDSLLVALRPEFIAQRAALDYAIRSGSSCNLLHARTGFKIDILILEPRPFSATEFARRSPARVAPGDPRTLCIASLEDVVLSKLEWYRKGGEVSDRHWRDVLGMIELRRGDLDHAYLDRWARELGVDDLLRRARAEAGA